MTLDCERLLQYRIELVTRPVVRGQKSVAKFHAVSLTYKKTLFETFLSQSAAAKASRKADEFDMGENKVATGRLGLFARFPFLKVGFFSIKKLKTREFFAQNSKFRQIFQKFKKIFNQIRITILV